ncbi:MAG TPA: methyl-accepting chemotaxis protein [Solirubrobacteraceae bacterium]|nr:methyl-accepting chemotaxis protein [Solirubrobacteraceae bacterium]
MSWFKNMSLAKKLYGVVGVLLLSLVLMGVMALSSLSSVDSKGSSMYSNNAISLTRVGNANTAFTDGQRLVLRGIVYVNAPAVQQQVDAGIAADQATFQRNLNQYANSGLAPAESSVMATLKPALAAYVPLRDKVRALTKAGNATAAAELNKQTVEEFNVVQSSLLKLTAFNQADAAKAATGISNTYGAGRTRTIVLMVAALLLGLGIAVFTVRQLVRSVKGVIDRMAAVETAMKENLTSGMQALAAGDLTVRLEAKTKPASEFSGDEFGRIMRQIESMRGAIVETYGAYNLTVDTLNSLIGEVSSTAGSVGAASKQMSSTSEEAGRATGEIAQAISEVAEGAERQVQLLEAAKQAADEVSAAVQQTAQQAQQTAEVATQAREAAKHGVSAAEQADGAMRSVSESTDEVTEAIRELAGKSEQIGAIVATITGIAEQTNLLALNAAIEAARAGEQGRGFAVVADEVRKLAEESQQAAHEISQLIDAIQAETGKVVTVVEDGARRTKDGASVVQQTREAFLTIGHAVDDITERIEQIAAAAQQVTATAATMQQSMGEVAAVAEGSSASTEQVSASTQETSASSQEIAASAHELASNAEQLNQLVGRFHISDSGETSAADVFRAAREAHEAWRGRLREAISTGTSAVSVEDAGKDDMCGFGKWIHGPGMLRDRAPERWQLLHDLHEQFHRNAAEVLALATSGRKADAQALIQSARFTDVERRLQDALRTPVAA